jgi:hypothetical protein
VEEALAILMKWDGCSTSLNTLVGQVDMDLIMVRRSRKAARTSDSLPRPIPPGRVVMLWYIGVRRALLASRMVQACTSRPFSICLNRKFYRFRSLDNLSMMASAFVVGSCTVGCCPSTRKPRTSFMVAIMASLCPTSSGKLGHSLPCGRLLPGEGTLSGCQTKPPLPFVKAKLHPPFLPPPG